MKSRISRLQGGRHVAQRSRMATFPLKPASETECAFTSDNVNAGVTLEDSLKFSTQHPLALGLLPHLRRFGLAANNDALYTFSFLMLLYVAVFSIVSARERRWFWATLPSKTFLSALAADALTGTALTSVGLPGLMPLPWWQTLAIFCYAMVSCLVVNDAVKVAMIRWRVLNAVAKKPVDLSPQIAKRAYELYEQRGRQDSQAVQDWGQAEREIRKDGPHKL